MPAAGDGHCMSLRQAEAMGGLWLSAGGNPHVDIAALEPLLWRDGKYRIADLVRAMRELGFSVSMTTNGHLLEQHAADLARVGLTKLRISWHSTFPDVFHQISATGNYTKFLRGIDAAMQSGVPVVFNRLLLRGCLDDLAEHITIIDKLQSRIKLYDLLWTPQTADVYETYFINAIEAANTLLSGLPKKRVEKFGAPGRRRLEFELENGGLVEIKESESVSRARDPCLSCASKDNCLEAFGDYIRIEPDMRLYFCYLRRDIGFDVRPLLEPGSPSVLVQMIGSLTEGRQTQFFRHSKLRYIAVPMCNFNCGFPGSATSWCHKATGKFKFPPRTATAAAVRS